MSVNVVQADKEICINAVPGARLHQEKHTKGLVEMN